ncbi:MAG: cyclic nucleotide-binding domain-containing protein, partial [Pseudomonadota bacterium]
IAINANSDHSQIRGIAGSPSYMSPEQVQSAEITHRSDLYSLGAVMYELLTGQRPFRAENLAKLLHKIVYATPPPIHTVRDNVPEILEEIVAKCLQKTPEDRYQNGKELAAVLTRAFQELRNDDDQINRQEQFEELRQLSFFHDFSHAEIWEVLRASDWRTYQPGQEIVREGELDDRFYIIVQGNVAVHRSGVSVGRLAKGDCFGEASYVMKARRTATIKARDEVTLLRVSSTLLEQVSTACQLHFTKTFLRSLIERLQRTAKNQNAVAATRGAA